MKNKLRFKYFYKDNFNWMDSEFIRKTRSDELIYKNLFITKKITRIEQEHWFEKEYSQDKNWHLWIAYDEDLSVPVSYISIKIDSIIHKRVHFNYVMPNSFSNKKFYHNNIMRFVINTSKDIEIDMHKLWTYSFLQNEKRIKYLCEKWNFEIDGILREHVHKDGEFRDVYVLSLLLT